MGESVDWEEYFADARQMTEGAHKRLYADAGRIRYVNARLKCRGQKESEWFFDVEFGVEEDMLYLREREHGREVRVAAQEVEYLKLRPFYFAACVGFKVFVFYAHEETASI